MTIRVLLVQPDGFIEEREVEPGLAAFRDLIGGGYLEGVGAGVDADWIGYADEEGRLKGMPVNKAATVIARNNGWPGDFLVGPVVFCGQRHGGEDGLVESDLPSGFVHRK